MAAQDMRVTISGDASSVIATLEKFKTSVTNVSKSAMNDLGNVGKSANGLLGNFGSLESVVAKVATAFAAIKMADFITDSTMLAARYEVLGGAMSIVGKNAGYTRLQMEGFENDLKKTGISAIGARDSLTKMAGAQLDLSKSSDLARMAQDAARVGNVNSTEAFNHMVQGIQSAQVETLRTIGINVSFEDGYKKTALELKKNAANLTESEKMQSRLNLVLSKAPQLAGVYADSLNTVGGQMKSMQRHVENLQVTFGDTFKPALTAAISFVGTALKETGVWFDKNKEAVGVLGSSLKSLVITLTSTVASLFRMMGGASGVTSSVKLLADAIGYLSAFIASGILQVTAIVLSLSWLAGQLKIVTVSTVIYTAVQKAFSAEMTVAGKASTYLAGLMGGPLKAAWEAGKLAIVSNIEKLGVLRVVLTGLLGVVAVAGAIAFGYAMYLDKEAESAVAASEAAADLAEKHKDLATDYAQTSSRLSELTAITKSNTATAKEKAQAQLDINKLASQALKDYPELNRAIRQEGENYIFTEKSMEKLIASKIKVLKMQAIALDEQAKTSRAEAADANNSGFFTKFVIYGRIAEKAERSAAAAEREAKAVRDTVAGLEHEQKVKALGGNDSKKPGGSTKDVMSGLNDGLEALRVSEAEKLKVKEVYYSLSKAQEMNYWADLINSGKFGGEVLKGLWEKYHTSRKAMAGEALAKEKADLDKELLLNSHNFDVQLKLADAFAEKIKTQHGKDSKEYEDALKKRDAIEQKGIEDKKLLNDKKVAMELEHELTMLDQASSYVTNMRAMGKITEVDSFDMLKNIEDEKNRLVKEGMQKRLDALRAESDQNVQAIQDLLAAMQALDDKQKGQDLAYNTKRPTITGSKEPTSTGNQSGSALAGFAEGVSSLTAGKTAFDEWREAGQSAVGGVASAFESFYMSLTQKGMTFGQKIKSLWMDISKSVIGAIGKMMASHMAEWALKKLIMAWDEISIAMGWKKTAAVVEQQETELAASELNAAGGFFATFSKMGPWGFALAALAIVGMFSLLSGLSGKATGGPVDKGTPYIVGEKGQELFVPDVSGTIVTNDALRNAQANMGANINGGGQVAQYNALAGEYSNMAKEAAANQGPSNAAIYDLRGSINVDTGSKQWADLVHQGAKTFARGNG